MRLTIRWRRKQGGTLGARILPFASDHVHRRNEYFFAGSVYGT